MSKNNEVPRRARMDLYVPAEKAIHDAMQEVEGMAADELLTEAVDLLQQAQNKVADYVDKEDIECVKGYPSHEK